MATSSDYDYPIDVNNIRILQCLPVHQSDVTCCDFAIGNDFIYVITGSRYVYIHLRGKIQIFSFIIICECYMQCFSFSAFRVCF